MGEKENQIKLKVLKAILLLRKFNRSSSKEEQVAEVNEWIKEGIMTEQSLQEWINGLKEEIAKSPEQQEKESKQFIEEICKAEAEYYQSDKEYYTSCTAGDYGPSNPWDAPGMSIRDFI